MPPLRTPLAVPVSLALLALAPTASSAPAVPPTDSLLPLLVTRGGAPAAALLALEETGPRHADAGPGIERADHFRAGSITKTFVATVALQLADEGRLSLSDTVEEHPPGLVRRAGNDGRAPTLRSLLTHTSGLHDFSADTRGTVPVPLFRPYASRSPTPRPTPAASPARTPTTSCSAWSSNRSPAARTPPRPSAASSLRCPLTGTSFPGSRTSPPSPHGRSYAVDGTDVTRLDPRVAGAAGESVTTLAGLDRFHEALLGGGLLPPRRLREMLGTRTAHGSYGMGLFPVRLPCGTTVWGHNGRISGSYVRTAATADGRHVLTFRVNTDAMADTGPEPAVLAADFCPRTS